MSRLYYVKNLKLANRVVPADVIRKCSL